ncbi:hypothetical protein [Kitasatospora aureofaciens]|uniref:hypothetical protein n=1 Tax=Kitasatospora aureofaciens TaxID=1894 RepID=UPI001C443A7B|nr:hypothetical protein [Kitasatospora aureofaciens]MBV6702172.1 hypothetical protein [Kitasatospora aureofaciens]
MIPIPAITSSAAPAASGLTRRPNWCALWRAQASRRPAIAAAPAAMRERSAVLGRSEG